MLLCVSLGRTPGTLSFSKMSKFLMEIFRAQNDPNDELFPTFGHHFTSQNDKLLRLGILRPQGRTQGCVHQTNSCRLVCIIYTIRLA